MTLEEFIVLSDDEKTAALKIAEQDAQRVSDLEAERDSLKEENKTIREREEKTAAELQKTKQLNFTLARNVAREPKRDPEELINDMFSRR